MGAFLGKYLVSVRGFWRVTAIPRETDDRPGDEKRRRISGKKLFSLLLAADCRMRMFVVVPTICIGTLYVRVSLFVSLFFRGSPFVFTFVLASSFASYFINLLQNKRRVTWFGVSVHVGCSHKRHTWVTRRRDVEMLTFSKAKVFFWRYTVFVTKLKYTSERSYEEWQSL